VAEDDFMEAGIPTRIETAPEKSLIFKVFRGLITVTRGRAIDNKIEGIMALHNGPIIVLLRIMSSANFAYHLVIQLLNVLSFTAMDNNQMSKLLSIMSPLLTLWIGFRTLVRINTLHLLLRL
jgi:hypothetical protein